MDTRASTLILVGDEAFTPDEWASERRQRERKGQRDRRAYFRTYLRERRFRRRHPGVEPVALRQVASLHDLRCTGPTRNTGCRCDKIVLEERVTP